MSIASELVGLDAKLLPVPVLHPLHVHQVLRFAGLSIRSVEASNQVKRYLGVFIMRRNSAEKSESPKQN